MSRVGTRISSGSHPLPVLAAAIEIAPLKGGISNESFS
jgi:hypothetical protein